MVAITNQKLERGPCKSGSNFRMIMGCASPKNNEKNRNYVSVDMKASYFTNNIYLTVC
jgi:hypothetical protein